MVQHSYKALMFTYRKELTPFMQRKKGLIRLYQTFAFLMVEMRGFALQRLLPKVNRVQPKGFTLQSNGTAFAVQNPRIDDIEKQVEQEVQLVSRLVEMRGFEPRFVLLHPTPSTCLFGD